MATNSAGDRDKTTLLGYDLSELIKRADALAQSERWLAESQRIAHLGHYTYDIQARVWDGSASFNDVLGTDENHVEDISGWLEIVHPDDREPLTRFFRHDVLANNVPFDTEYRIVRPRDGAERWVHGVGRVERAPDGTPLMMFGIIQDITEAKRRDAYATLDREVLEIFNRVDDFGSSVEKVVLAIKQSTGADAVGIRLQEGEEYPYFAQLGFSESHMASEDTLLMRNADDEICRDRDGRAILECSCGLVLSGRPHSGLSAGGSLWTDDAQLPDEDVSSAEDPRVNPRNLCVREGYASIAVVPVKDADKIIGVVHLADRRRRAIDLEAVGMLEGIVAHIGEGLARKYAHEEVLKTNERLEKVLKSIVTSMGKVVEARDPYTQGHEQGVAQICRQIAEEMGLSQPEIAGIEVAALVHDVGKLAIPTEILNKPGRLSEVEFGLIKGHSQAGYNILRDIEFDWPVADIVLQHHERMDGSGYPNGLAGPQILMAARILMVADVVEAMAAHRPYRPALGLEAAVAEIKDHPQWFDSDVVASLLRLHTAGLIEV